MPTNLPSFKSAQELWGMGQIQLIQLLMHFWGLYQALLQKHECLEKNPTKVIDFDGNSAPQTDSDKVAIVQGRVTYLEIENDRLKRQLAQQQTLLAQQQAQIAHQQAQLAMQQQTILELNNLVAFWMSVAKEFRTVANGLLDACKRLFFDPVSLESLPSDGLVLCVGVKYAPAFFTTKPNVEKMGNKHPLVQNDFFVKRDCPGIDELSKCARDSDEKLSQLPFY